MDSIRQLGSQTEIVKENGNHKEMLDSGSIIPKEISSQDGEFDSKKIVEVIAEEMDQSVNITDNNNIKFEPNKENESLFKDTFANEVIAEKTIQSVNITDNNNSKFEENKENNGLQLGIFEKEKDKKEKIDTDTGNVADTTNQEKVGLLIKEVKIETDEGTKRIKENDRSLEDDTFTINEDKSTMDSIRQLGSQTEIVKINGNHEEMLDSGSIIPKEISSQDGEFDSQKIVEVIAEDMDQSVNITDNNNS